MCFVWHGVFLYLKWFFYPHSLVSKLTIIFSPSIRRCCYYISFWLLLLPLWNISTVPFWLLLTFFQSSNNVSKWGFSICSAWDLFYILNLKIYALDTFRKILRSYHSDIVSSPFSLFLVELLFDVYWTFPFYLPWLQSLSFTFSI